MKALLPLLLLALVATLLPGCSDVSASAKTPAQWFESFQTAGSTKDGAGLIELFSPEVREEFTAQIHDWAQSQYIRVPDDRKGEIFADLRGKLPGLTREEFDGFGDMARDDLVLKVFPSFPTTGEMSREVKAMRFVSAERKEETAIVRFANHRNQPREFDLVRIEGSWRLANLKDRRGNFEIPPESSQEKLARARAEIAALAECVRLGRLQRRNLPRDIVELTMAHSKQLTKDGLFSELDEREAPKDPWGTPYRLDCSDERPRLSSTYVISSLGEDRKESEDDIREEIKPE